MNDFEIKVMEKFEELSKSISSLETTVKMLPCTQHTNQIIDLRLSKAKNIGIITGVSAVVTMIISLLKGSE